MRTPRIRYPLVLLGLGLAMAVAGPLPAQVPCDVLEGYDLLSTREGTQFAIDPSQPPIDLLGTNIRRFDFSEGSGCQPAAGGDDVGNADTIVHRLQDTLDPAAESCPPAAGGDACRTIQIEMVALCLRSEAPVDLDGPGPESGDFLFVSLQPDTPSLGTMDITCNGGDPHVFTSSIDVAFEVRQGGFGGPLVNSGQTTLSTPQDVPWQRTSDTAQLIPCRNFRLNGSEAVDCSDGDTSQDFFPVGIFAEQKLPGQLHRVTTAVPLTGGPALGTAAAAVLILALLAILSFAVWRMRPGSSAG